MSRLTFRSRRGRWLLFFAACALAVLATLLFGSRGFTVAVYNDTQATWSRATLIVGREVRRLPPLGPRGNAAETFPAPAETAGVELSIEGERIVHWSAPYLVQPNTARILIHVDPWGGVRATVEPRLLSRFWSGME